MSSGADVRSISVLREWYAAMALYREDIAESLGGITLELRRGEDWLHEQLGLWEQAVKACHEEVHHAKMELSARKVPNATGKMPDTTLQERDLRRARAKLEHAEEKVQVCKKWINRLPKQIEEAYTGPSHRLGVFLDGELDRGMALMVRQAEALEQYADLRADYASGASIPVAGEVHKAEAAQEWTGPAAPPPVPQKPAPPAPPKEGAP